MYFWLITGRPVSADRIASTFIPNVVTSQPLRNGRVSYLIDSPISNIDVYKILYDLDAMSLLWVNQRLIINGKSIGGHDDVSAFNTFIDTYALTYANETLSHLKKSE